MWDDIMDTQGAVGAGDDYIVVVFRGTKEGADWITNLKFVQEEFPGLGRVHKVSQDWFFRSSSDADDADDAGGTGRGALGGAS